MNVSLTDCYGASNNDLKTGRKWAMLSRLLPAVDITQEATSGRLPFHVRRMSICEHGSSRSDHCDAIARVLYRRYDHHVLIVGQGGVGRTAVVWEFGRRAATGEIAFLKDRRVFWVDCSNVLVENSRACLELIFQAASEQADGPGIVLCLDGLDSLLRRPMAASNRALIEAATVQNDVRIIGIVSNWAFNELVVSDAGILSQFSRVDVEEPDEATTLEIVRQAADRLEKEYDAKVSQQEVRRAISLSSSFILNRAQPSKAIRVLRHAVEDVEYERTQHGRNGKPVGAEDIIRAVSRMTGIPAITLAGKASETDYSAALGEAVVGQDVAVQAVATELKLIKTGLTEPGKPASVMLFAGLTGVGKTELAKQLAEIYSASKRLQVYTMANFIEPHSVSGIIGVPPGYVGHELGGRLINDLNADPYSVFLLDEAEKAHPNVWMPFLNLFDEGWIVDQRGTKAYADRAIFILTSNAGDNAIAQMTKQGKSSAEITEHVKRTLTKIRQERTGKSVFSPQFLARLKRIVIFGTLGEAAMIGICRKTIRQVQKLWQSKRDLLIEVSGPMIEAIGHRAFQLNEQAQGQEGGRIVRKLVTELIEHRIQDEAMRTPTDYAGCRRIVVHATSDCLADPSVLLGDCKEFVKVEFLQSEGRQETPQDVAL